MIKQIRRCVIPRLALVLALFFVDGHLSLHGQSLYTPPYAFTTLAGNASNSEGSSNGTGSAASFFNPYNVAVDGSGNVYVADTSNSIIRMITPAGVVTTIAGAALVTGSTDGPGGSALFDNPIGVAVDGSGNVYVGDTGNDTIRKITLVSGVWMVSTLAGSAGNYGSSNGTGSAASFENPNGVAVDGSGNVYVADYMNSTIRKVTSAGVVTTLAGSPNDPGHSNGTGSAALFNGPNGVAVDGSGNVYVADTENQLIRKVTSAGVVTTIAGTATVTGSTDGPGTSALFNFPTSVAVDGSGNLYVADYSNFVIRKITPGEVVTTVAGSVTNAGSTNGTGIVALFNSPTGVAVDGSGNVYVADTGNNLIRKGTPPLPQLYFQNGTSLGALSVNTSFLPNTWTGIGTLNSGWQEQAIGDINGDGVPDLIFQNGTLIGAVTLNASGAPTSWIGIGAMNAGWELRGAGYITGDGNLDLIFQDGTLIGYLEVNTSGVPVSWNGIGALNTGWELRAVADLTGDGYPDLIFQNGTLIGALQVNTSGVPTAWNGIGELNAGWTLSYAAYVGADGQPDLIFQNGTLIGALEVNTSFAPVAWHGIGAMGSGWILPGDY
jgi:hypothetical protein